MNPSPQASIGKQTPVTTRQSRETMEANGSSLPTEYLLTSEDVAKLLVVSREVLHNMVHHRQIPHLKIGRRLRFDPREIAAWLEAKKVPSHVPR